MELERTTTQEPGLTAHLDSGVGSSGEQAARSSDLIARMRLGDRTAAAEFLTRNGPIIRQRYRRKIGRSLRRLVESCDVLASIGRRLDHLVVRGSLNLENEAQLWALVVRLGNRVVADQARMLTRLRRSEDEERAWTAAVLARAERGGVVDDEELGEVMETAFASLPSDIDRSILSQWLCGNGHATIAATLGLEPASVRKRWERIRGRLEEVLA